MVPRIRVWLVVSVVLIFVSRECGAVATGTDEIEDEHWTNWRKGESSEGFEDVLDLDEVETGSVDGERVLQVDNKDSLQTTSDAENSSTSNQAGLASAHAIDDYKDDTNLTSFNATEEARPEVEDVDDSVAESSDKESATSTEHEDAEPLVEELTTKLEAEDDIIISKVSDTMVEPSSKGSSSPTDTDAVMESSETLVSIDTVETESDDKDPEGETGAISASMSVQTESSDNAIDDIMAVSDVVDTVIEPPDKEGTLSTNNEESEPRTSKPGSLASLSMEVSEKENVRSAGESPPEPEDKGEQGEVEGISEDHSNEPIQQIHENTASEGHANESVSELRVVEENDTQETINEDGVDSPTDLPSSLASIYQKVNTLQEAITGDDKYESSDQTYGYTSVWGHQKQRRVDEHVLRGVLEQTRGTGAQSHNVVAADNPESLDDSVPGPGTADLDEGQDNDNRADSTRVPKSVNTEFVEGLDDIDKFLEEVEPPDELDVGAAGSSMQDVLVGQGAQILTKHVAIVLSRIKQSLQASRVKEFFASRRTEDGNFALVTRDELERALEILRSSCTSLVRNFQAFWEELFEDDDEESMQFEEATKLESIRQGRRHQGTDSWPVTSDGMEAFMQQKLNQD